MTQIFIAEKVRENMTEPFEMLVLALPVEADMEALEAWREYFLRGIAERFLVLPKGAELELHEIPALAAVEVKPKPAQRSAPTPTGEVLREKLVAPPERPVSKSGRWALPMTAGEIIADYKQAKRPSAQIKVLAELNCTSEDMIRNILADGGVDVKKKK